MNEPLDDLSQHVQALQGQVRALRTPRRPSGIIVHRKA